MSARHGLLTWTPVTLLAVIGLLRLRRRNAELAGVPLAILVALVLSNCTVIDWWAGTAFGMRRLVSATPLFVLGLAVPLDDVRCAGTRRIPRAARGGFIAPLVFAGFGMWNILLMAQFALGMISHPGPVPLSTIAANQPKVIARLIELPGEILQ